MMFIPWLMLLWTFTYPDHSADEAVSTYQYNLDLPYQSMILDGALKEISGMDITERGLFAIEDEHGRVYHLNEMTGEIIASWEFKGKGDYEDLAVVDDYAYVIKSNGNLYVTELFSDDEEATKKYDSGFDSEMNFEGLCFEPESRRFFMAAKRSSSHKIKELYAQSIETLDQPVFPVYKFDQEIYGDYHRSKKNTWSQRLAHDIGNLDYSFNPSAIAVHPKTNDLYVISSPIPQLLVLDKNWKIRSLEFLDERLFTQPEALTFDDDGIMYIANEGGNGQPNILKFSPQ